MLSQRSLLRHLAGFCFMVLLVGCATEPQLFTPGFKPQWTPPHVYDYSKEITVEGVVEQAFGVAEDDKAFADENENGFVGYISPVNMQIVAPNKKRYLVQLGPSWFLQVKKIEVKPGQQVKVKGTIVKGADAEDEDEDDAVDSLEGEQLILLARKVYFADNKKIVLRSKKGTPKWYGHGRAIGMQKNWQDQMKVRQAEMMKNGSTTTAQ